MQIIKPIRRTIKIAVRKRPQPEKTTMRQGIQTSTAESPSRPFNQSPMDLCSVRYVPGLICQGCARSVPRGRFTPPLPHFCRNRLNRKGLAQRNPFRPLQTKNLPPMPGGLDLIHGGLVSSFPDLKQIRNAVEGDARRRGFVSGQHGGGGQGAHAVFVVQLVHGRQQPRPVLFVF